MKKETIVVASSNKGKIREIKEIFKDYEVLSIKDMEEKLNKKIIVNENKDTYKDNALEKVRDLYEQVGEEYICIADDSGISIDILDGFPGVHTARWLDADDHTKNLELLKKVDKTPKDKRTCSYTTVIALKSKNPTLIAARCTVFAESDLVHKAQIGCKKEDLIAGLCKSVADNYLNNVEFKRISGIPQKCQ